MYSTSVQSWVKWLETICSSNFPLYRDLPLYEVHQIRRAASHQLFSFAIEFGLAPMDVSSVAVPEYCLGGPVRNQKMLHAVENKS